MSYCLPKKFEFMKKVLSVLFMAFYALTQAQTNFFLHIKPTFAGQPLQLQTNVPALNGQIVNIDHFNYYVSDILLYHDGGMLTPVNQSVFIFTPTEQGYFLGDYGIQQLDSIQFMVGVPSRFNTQQGSEAQDISSFPLSHPLSFQSPSMYWGWQYGYMHMVVGGNADSDNNQQPDAYFELHNLGKNNQRVVQMPVVATQSSISQQDIYLDCNLDKWLQNMPLSTLGVVHGESGLNNNVMANVNIYRVFSQPENASVPEVLTTKFYVFENTVYLETSEAERLEVYDCLGRKVQEFKIDSPQKNLPLDLTEGIYVLSLYGTENSCMASRKCRILRP